MAQSRERRKQRRKQHARPAPARRTTVVEPRRRNLRRIVIAFMVLIGLAGILALSATPDDPNGAAVPMYARR